MIGYTNSTASKPMPGEYINVRLLTNQSSHSDLNGIAFTVEYEGQSKDYVWEGSEVTVLIPADMEYTVKFKDVEGYKTPESVTYVAVEENSRDIEALYQCELLTVNVSADEGEVSGFEVKITGYKVLGEALPDGYTPLEYIESTGSQYIDTGFKPNQDTRVVMDVQCLIEGSNYFLFGARTNNNDNDNAALTYGFNAYSTFYRSHYYNGWKDFSTSVKFTDRFILDKNKNVTTIGGSNVITHTYTTFQCAYNMYLFAANTENTAGTFGKAKLYSCQIYDNGTLVRDFVPVKRSDGMAGLYDKVNKAFYASASSTALVAGAELLAVDITQTTASATHKIPFGVKYTVSASGIDGFTTPASQSFIAAESVRNLSLVYEEAKMGVFIQGISGKLYTKDEWNSQETPNGIAVLTEQCRVVMALDYKEGLIWSSPAISYSDTIYIANNIEEAYLDYNGAKNTDGIINGGSSTEAAIYCRDTYTFPNGKKGYLGSVGELNMIIRNNGSVVFGIYALLKGENFPAGMALWTSTLKTGFYPYILAEGYEFEPFYQDDTFCALPLSQLTTEQDLIQFTINGKTYEALEGTKWENWCSSAFNTDGFAVENNRVEASNGYTVTSVPYDYGEVGVSDEIVSGATYYLINIPL